MCFKFQEVDRIRKEHPDDESAIMNDRVKGYLKVTRAFGAGFLKQVYTHTHTPTFQGLIVCFFILVCKIN